MAKDGAKMKSRKRMPRPSLEVEVQAALRARKPGDESRDGLPQWPPGKAFPKFKTDEEEHAFYGKWDFAEHNERSGVSEAVVYEPRATSKAREHVFRLRFDDQEMATLQRVAKRRGVAIAAVLRDAVRAMEEVR